MFPQYLRFSYLSVFVFFVARWLQVCVCGEQLVLGDITPVWCLMELLYVIMAILAVI